MHSLLNLLENEKTSERLFEPKQVKSIIHWSCDIQLLYKYNRIIVTCQRGTLNDPTIGKKKKLGINGPSAVVDGSYTNHVMKQSKLNRLCTHEC